MCRLQVVPKCLVCLAQNNVHMACIASGCLGALSDILRTCGHCQNTGRPSPWFMQAPRTLATGGTRPHQPFWHPRRAMSFVPMQQHGPSSAHRCRSKYTSMLMRRPYLWKPSSATNATETDTTSNAILKVFGLSARGRQSHCNCNGLTSQDHAGWTAALLAGHGAGTRPASTFFWWLAASAVSAKTRSIDVAVTQRVNNTKPSLLIGGVAAGGYSYMPNFDAQHKHDCGRGSTSSMQTWCVAHLVIL